jgi:hypothetical protein
MEIYGRQQSTIDPLLILDFIATSPLFLINTFFEIGGSNAIDYN